MTKNSELIVMRACGISLYRAAAPLVLFAMVAAAGCSGCRSSCSRARTARPSGSKAQSAGGRPTNRARSTAGSSATGDIYHYDLFDPDRDRFTHLRLSPRRARPGV